MDDDAGELAVSCAFRGAVPRGSFLCLSTSPSSCVSDQAHTLSLSLYPPLSAQAVQRFFDEYDMAYRPLKVYVKAQLTVSSMFAYCLPSVSSVASPCIDEFCLCGGCSRFRTFPPPLLRVWRQCTPHTFVSTNLWIATTSRSLGHGPSRVACLSL